MIIRRQKIAILELSSSRVNLLIGPKVYKKFRVSDFLVYNVKTNTKDYMSGGKMDTEAFIKYVLPEIQKLINIAKENNAEIVLCVATEWARECRNMKEIEKLLPFPVLTLSKEQEAKITSDAYLETHTRNLKKYKDIVFVDSGSLSTEIYVLGKEFKSAKNTSLRLLRNKFEYIRKEPEVLIVISISLWDPKTGKGTRMNLHDTDFPKEVIQNDPELREVFEILGLNHDISVNGTTLIFGTYYNKLKNKL